MPAKSSGQRHEQAVGGFFSRGRVDLAQPIEIEQQHGGAAVVERTPHAVEFALQQLHEQDAVGQAGHRVLTGLGAGARLVFLGFLRHALGVEDDQRREDGREGDEQKGVVVDDVAAGLLGPPDEAEAGVRLVVEAQRGDLGAGVRYRPDVDALGPRRAGDVGQQTVVDLLRGENGEP